eukprot:tig00000204_g17714.t1
MRRYRASEDALSDEPLVYVGVTVGRDPENDDDDAEAPVVEAEFTQQLDLGTLADLHDEMARNEERNLARALAQERIAVAADENVWIPNGAFASLDGDGRERNLTLPLSKDNGSALLASGSPPPSPPMSARPNRSASGSPLHGRATPEGLARVSLPFSPSTDRFRANGPSARLASTQPIPPGDIPSSAGGPGARWEDWSPKRLPSPDLGRYSNDGGRWNEVWALPSAPPQGSTLAARGPFVRSLPPAPAPAPGPAPPHTETPPGPLPLPLPSEPSPGETTPSSSGSPGHGGALAGAPAPAPSPGDSLDVTAVRAELDREKTKIAALEEELRSILSHWANRPASDRAPRPALSPQQQQPPQQSPQQSQQGPAPGPGGAGSESASSSPFGRARKPRTLLTASLFERAPMTPPDSSAAQQPARVGSPFGAPESLAERLAAILRDRPDPRTPERPLPSSASFSSPSAPPRSPGRLLPASTSASFASGGRPRWGSTSSEAAEESDEADSGGAGALHVVGPPSKGRGPEPASVPSLAALAPLPVVLAPSPRRPSAPAPRPPLDRQRPRADPESLRRLPGWRTRPEGGAGAVPDVGASAPSESEGASPEAAPLISPALRPSTGPLGPSAASGPAGPSAWVRPLRLLTGEEAASPVEPASPASRTPSSSLQASPLKPHAQPPVGLAAVVADAPADPDAAAGGPSVQWLQEQRARFRQSVIAAERRFMEQLSALKEAQAARSAAPAPPEAPQQAAASALLPRVTRESLAPGPGWGDAGFGSGSDAADDADALPSPPPPRAPRLRPRRPPPPLDADERAAPPPPSPASASSAASSIPVREALPPPGRPARAPARPRPGQLFLAARHPFLPLRVAGRDAPDVPAHSAAPLLGPGSRPPSGSMPPPPPRTPATPVPRGPVLLPVPELLPTPDTEEFKRQLPGYRPPWIPPGAPGEEDPFVVTQQKGAVMEKLLLVRPTLRLADLGTDPVCALFAGPPDRVDMRSAFDELEVAWLRSSRGRRQAPAPAPPEEPEEEEGEEGPGAPLVRSGFFDALDL